MCSAAASAPMSSTRFASSRQRSRRPRLDPVEQPVNQLDRPEQLPRHAHPRSCGGDLRRTRMGPWKRLERRLFGTGKRYALGRGRDNARFGDRDAGRDAARSASKRTAGPDLHGVANGPVARE